MSIRLPPLIFPLALLAWAWQSGHWLAGGAAGIWLEWAVRTSWRWSLSERDIHRLVDLTTLALIAVAIYHYSDGPLAQAIFALLHGSPLLLLPLLSAQLLSGRTGLERRALFYSQRRSRDPSAQQEIDLRLPYLAACLLAAGQNAALPVGYFPLLMLFLALLLWWNRPDRSRIGAWLLLLGLAAGLGYGGQMGLRQAQARLEDAAIDWLTGLFAGDTDPYRASTAFGDVGTLRLSDRILYRVETPAPLDQALLLRTAAYNRYLDGTWFANERGFAPVPPAATVDAWQWGTEPASGEGGSARIAAYLEGKRSILPLPTAAWRVEGLPVSELMRIPFGAVRVGEGPGLVRYLARYGQATAHDAPPEEADLRVPPQERPALKQIAAQWELAGLGPERAMLRIQTRFQQRFRYTQELPGPQSGETALSHFLLKRQRGHCEYFATATVLLLRQMGIPARYAVGYSVQEAGDGRQGEYLVRHSHAHAWALAWRDGRWWDLDTTPALWYQAQTAKAPLWQPLLDWLSDRYYHYTLQRLEGTETGHNPWLWGALALLFLLLGYRLRLGQAFRLRPKPTPAKTEAKTQSPLSAIEAALTKAGHPRHPWETHGDWLHRLRQHPELMQACAGLEPIRRLHYRQRYRDEGLHEAESNQMQELVQRWLEQWD